MQENNTIQQDSLKSLITDLYNVENPEKAKRLNDDVINNIVSEYNGDYKAIVKGLYEHENPEKAKRLNPEVFDNIGKRYGFGNITPQNIESEPAPVEKVENKTSNGGFGREQLLHASSGLGNIVYKGTLNIPDNAMRIVSMGLNPIARALGIPEYKAGDFNKYTGISKVEDIIDAETTKYKEEIDRINPRFEEGVIEAMKKGDVGLGFRNLSGGLAESFVPSLMMMLLPSTGMSVAGQVGSSTAMFGSSRLKELDETMPELPEAQKLIAANVNGAFEGIFEQYFGSGAVGEALAKNILKSQGKQVGEETLKKGIRSMFSDVLTKYPALAPFGEMYEEMGTQVAQNLTDKLTGVSPDINAIDGMWEAGILGFAGGASHGGMIGGSNKAVKAIQKHRAKRDFRNQVEQTLQPIINPNTGKIHKIKNDNDEVFFLMDETEGGMYAVKDAAGNVKTIHKDEFQDPEIVEPNEELLNEVMGWEQQYDAQQELEKQERLFMKPYQSIPDQFEYNGNQYRFSKDRQDIREDGSIQVEESIGEDEWALTQLTPEQTQEVISQFNQPAEQEFDENGNIPQSEIIDKPKPVIKLGKKEYEYEEQEDGSTIINAGQSDFKNIQDNLRSDLYDVELITEDIEPDTSLPGWVKQEQKQEVKGIRITPKEQAEQGNSAEPSYLLNGEAISKEDAIAEVEFAESLADLEGLEINNDEKLSKLISKKFPELNPTYEYNGKSIDRNLAASYINRARSADHLSNIKVENDEEMQSLWKQRKEELGLTQKEEEQKKLTDRHNLLVRELKMYNDKPKGQRNSNEMGRIMSIANELGYQVSQEDGRLVVTNGNGARIREKTAARKGEKTIENIEQEKQGLIQSLFPSAEFLETGLGPKEVRQAINDIQEGKTSVVAQTLLESLDKMTSEGVVTIKGDHTTGQPSIQLPVEEYLSTMVDEITPEEEQFAQSIPDEMLMPLLDEIDNEPSLADLEAYELLFNELQNGNTTTEQQSEVESRTESTTVPETETKSEVESVNQEPTEEVDNIISEEVIDRGRKKGQTKRVFEKNTTEEIEGDVIAKKKYSAKIDDRDISLGGRTMTVKEFKEEFPLTDDMNEDGDFFEVWGDDTKITISEIKESPEGSRFNSIAKVRIHGDKMTLSIKKNKNRYNKISNKTQEKINAKYDAELADLEDKKADQEIKQREKQSKLVEPSGDLFADIQNIVDKNEVKKEEVSEFAGEIINKEKGPEKPQQNPNKVFTEDAKNAALERLRKSRGQLNTGIDPQQFMDMVTVAGYHIESGARKFTDFANRMIEDVGQWVKPHLKGLYENIRRYPGMETVSKDMDSTDFVDNYDFDEQISQQINKDNADVFWGAVLNELSGNDALLTKINAVDRETARYVVGEALNKAQTSIRNYFVDQGQNHIAQSGIKFKDDVFETAIQQYLDKNYKNEDNQVIEKKQSKLSPLVTGGRGTLLQTPKEKLINSIKQRITSDTRISNTPQLTQLANDAGLIHGRDYTNTKELYDIASFALNEYIRGSKLLFNPEGATVDEVKVIIKALDRKMNLLPTETTRSADMVEKQQFSTPPAFAFIANWIAQVNKNDTVLEPSAGEGNIAVFAKNAGAKVIVNEIDKKRSGLLNKLFDKVLNEDAKHLHAIKALKDIPVTTVVMNPPFSRDIALGGKMDIHAAEKHMEAALNKLEDEGRLVAIVGRGMAMDSKTHKAWFDKIGQRFNIKANILVSGDAYSKKGTNFDNRLIIIDNNGETYASEILTGEVQDYSELVDLLSKVSDKPKLDYNEINNRNSGERKASQPSNTPNKRGEQPGGTNAIPTGRSGRNNSGQTENGGLFDQFVDAAYNDSRKLPKSKSGTSQHSTKTENGRIDERVSNTPSSTRNTKPETGQLSNSKVGGLKLSRTNKKIDSSGDNVGYDQYVPELKIEGSKQHPTKLVESTAMASVPLPEVDYIPQLPKDKVESGALSDAQLEDIVLAGNSHNQVLPDGKRRGYFLGAGTGYGKGRTIAGIILDNWNQGRKKAVWVSKNDDAHSQSADYWKAVGGNPKVIFEQKNAKTPIAAKEGVLLTKYGTLSNKFDKRKDYSENTGFWSEKHENRLQQIAQWLGKDFDGVIVFDESHLMANAKDTKRVRGTKKASNMALAGLELQHLLPNARVVYSSATGATEVTNLVYAQRLGLWGDGTPFANSSDFIQAVENSGVAGMELISRDLKAMGLYTAKTLSFDGVQYDTVTHNMLPEQKELYNKVARAWQKVLENINDAIEINNTSSQSRNHVMSRFWNVHQSFFSNIITTIQMPTLLNDIQEMLSENKAVVVQLVNTNDAATKRALAEKKAEVKEGEKIDFDDMDVSPKRMLIEYLQRSFPVALFQTTLDENGNEVQTMVRDSEGNPVENPTSVAKRDALIEELDREIQLPESPLDILINTFGVDNVAEITGRSSRIISKLNDNGDYEKIEEPRTNKTIDADRDAFMDGEKNVLVFSAKGGTGASYHADLDRKNQKQRVHYVLQAGWRADGAVQGFGRSHRSNQAVAPIFKIVTTNLKAQRRFLSSIARRLDQLGALTKGQRQTGGQGILDGSFNLEGTYAKQALFEFYKDVEFGKVPGVSMDVLQQQMALKIYKEDENGNREYNDQVVFNTKMFLNRLMSLEVDLMDDVFDGFSQRLEEEINIAKSNGSYDEGIEVVKALSTKVANEQEIYSDDKTGAKTYITDIETEVPNEKTDFDTIVSRMRGYGKKFKGFYGEEKSGRVYGIVQQDVVRADGSRQTKYRRFSVVTDTFIEPSDYYGKYQQLDEPIAREAWNKEFEEYPATRKKTDHIVKGLILPIWNRLPEKISVKRYIDDEGNPHLGRYFSKRDIQSIKSNFEVANKETYTPEQLVNVLNQGGYVKLSNGFEFVKKTHQGNIVYKINNANSYRDRERLVRSGAEFIVKSSMSMSGDFIVPNANANEVIGSIIDLYNAPAIEVEDSEGNPIRGSKTENNTISNDENIPTIKSGSELISDNNILESVSEYEHTKTGEILFNVKPKGELGSDKFKNVVEIAKKHNPYNSRMAYSRYSKGFLFKNINDAVNFKNEVDSNKDDIKLRKASPQGYYSTVEDALDKISQNKGTVGQFRSMLLKNGAKQAELDWMGWDEMTHKEDFDQVDPKAYDAIPITKQEIQDWINENRIEVQEVEKGEKIDYKTAFGVERNEMSEEELEIAEFDEQNGALSDTKYSQYQTPGGENYKELLLTMPQKTRSKFESMTDEELGRLYESEVGYNPFDEGENRESVINLLRGNKETNKKDNVFSSSHFDEPNILAHIRFNERTDANGDRVLFLEEIQSDWAQEGKKKGFKGNPIRTDLSYIDYRTQLWEKYNVDSVEALQGKASDDELTTLSDLWDKEDNTSGKVSDAVPNMPFKQTSQWVNLAMRRMMRYAAENGFDRIAWTNGEQQAERYDLSKQVDAIDWVESGSRKYITIEGLKGSSGQDIEIAVNKDTGIVTTMDFGSPVDWKDKHLSDIVGKEVSDKILKKEKGRLQDEGLKVGGEGMKAFYDKIIPSSVSKITKKFGAKVEPVEIITGKNDAGGRSFWNTEEALEQFRIGNEVLIEERYDASNKYIAENESQIKKAGKNNDFMSTPASDIKSTVQSIPVTDKMVQSVMEGIPLFKEQTQTAPVFDQLKSNQLKEYFNRMFANGKNTGTVHVVESPDKIPDQFRNKVELGNAFGLFDPETGDTYFITGNIPNVSEAFKTWVHEVGVHRGLSNVIPKPYQKALFTRLVDDIGMEEIKKVLPEEYHNEPKDVIGEEYLAFLGEKIINAKDLTQQEKSVWRKFIDQVREIINKLFFKNKAYTVEDAENLVRASVQSVYQMPMPNMEDYADVFEYAQALVNYRENQKVKANHNDLPGTNIENNNDNPDIRFRKSTDPVEFFNKTSDQLDRKPSKRDIKKTVDDIRQAIQDRSLPVKRFLEEAVKRGGRQLSDANPYRDLTLAFGRAEKLLDDFESKHMQGVVDAVSLFKKDKSIDNHKIMLYTIAKHASERNAQIRKEKLNEWEAMHPKPIEEEKQFDWEIEKENYQSYLADKDFSGILSQDKSGDYAGDPDGYANFLVEGFEQMVTKDKIDQYWKAIRKVNEFTLKRWLDGNQITKTRYDQMMEGYKFYVPLKGWWEDAVKEFDYHSGTGTGKSLRHAEGRTSLPDNPLAYIEHQAFKSISEQIDNEVNQQMLNFFMDNMSGNEDMMQMNRIYYYLTPEGDWKPTLERPSREMFESGGAKMVKYSDHFKMRKPAHGHEHEVWVNTKHGTYAMVFPKHPEVAQALNHQNNLVGGINFEGVNKALTGSIGRITNLQKALYTSWNIVFPVKNIMRDLPEAGSHILIQYGKKQAADFTKAVPKAFKLVGKYLYNNSSYKPQYDKEGNPTNIDGHFENFMNYGGQTGFTHLKEPEQIQKEIDKRVSKAGRKYGKKNLRDQLTRFSQTFEDTTRFAAYISGVENGMTPKDAAALAKEVSVNFNRKGKLSKTFDSLYAFFNAAIQAGQKNLKLAKDNPKAFTAVAAGWAVLGGLISELNRWIDDDDEYERLSEYVRMNYLVFPIGDGKYFRLPLPQFFRGFYAIGANISNLAHGKSTVGQAVGQASLNFINALSPIDVTGFIDKDREFSLSPLVPTAVKPVHEVSKNENFMGYPIYNEAFTKEMEKRIADSSLHKKNVNTAIKFFTDSLYKLGGGDSDRKSYYKDGKIHKVPGMMDVNPSKIEHILKSYSGGTGAFVTDFVTTMYDLSENNIQQDNIPYINSFIRKYPEKKWEILRQYYEMSDKDKEWQDLAKNYKKQGRYENFSDMMSDPQKAKRHFTVKATNKRLDALNKYFEAGILSTEEYLDKRAEIMETAINNSK